MAKFIEVHQGGQPMLVNIDMVQKISLDGEKAMILFDKDWFTVDENYEQMRLMIGSAQGGIPMDKSKSY